ncbi:MAG: LuxR C-terminal-related transcriptional regulator [Candidatus Promineifilaceae bacterium]
MARINSDYFTDPILRTKLHQPFLRPVLVPRPRLKEQIARGLRGPLTLITAPAGFGKTTLIASSIASCGMPVAWLSLDKDDNQLHRFLTYLVAAIQTAEHAVGIKAAQLLEAANKVPTDAVLISLINDLDVTGEEIALVLDDYQIIANRDVHKAIVFLLERCPRSFHLVIATRSDPPLPAARLRARSQIVELRTADLRFTKPEAAQFLNDLIGLNLDENSVTALEERTEGWIAGLQMAAISMRDRRDTHEFIAGFTGTNRFILDYLMEEVLASQSLKTQHFLLYTSFLDRLTAPLCDFILAMNEITWPADEGWLESVSLPLYTSSSMLDFLERANLFLVPLDDERAWYRYHHLFADLLQARLHQAHPDVVPRLHMRASTWLEQQGFYSESIHHLLAAQEVGYAADLIERYGPGLLAKSDPSVLQLADSLPLEIILARPKLGLYQAWLLITQGKIVDVFPLLNGLWQQLANTQSDSEQVWMQVVVASALAFLNPQANRELLPDYRLLEQIPADEPILRNAADFLFGMALGRRGDIEDAIKVSLKSIQRENNAYRSEAIPTMAPLLSRLYLIQGRLHAAASLCREFLNPIKESGIRHIHTAGSMKIDLGEVLYEWNQLEEAEQYVREGLQDNEPWQNIMTDGFGLTALARILQAKGDYSGALRVVRKFESRLQEHSWPREFEEDFHTLKIRLQLAAENLRTTSQWATQILLSKGSEGYEALYRLTLARVRLAEGRYADVEQLLAGTVPPIAAGSQISRQLESDLILAAAIAGQQRLTEAFGVLERCLATAEPEGYIRVFLDIGDPVQNLLTAYLRAGASRHNFYTQKLVDAFSIMNQISPSVIPTAVLVEPLTEREIEVLQLIALGKTNKEIARQLIVAPGTVKAHTASIYRKLDVTNRTEAASRARQIGILS